MENYGLMTLDEMIKKLGDYTNAWIFEDGKIKSDVLVIDTRDFLEKLKKYEIEDYTIFYPLIEELREKVKTLVGLDQLIIHLWILLKILSILIIGIHHLVIM